MPTLNSIIKDLNKKFGEGVVTTANNLKEDSIPRFPSGSLYLDKMLGTNQSGESGFPRRIIEIYGPQMAGKSTLSMKTIAEVQKLGFKTAYIDCEKSFENTRAEALGIDISNLLVITEHMGEKVFEIISDLLRTGEFGVIVIDSTATLITKREADTSMEESSRMAALAQLMSTGLRKITALNKNDCLIIFINQLREKPGVIHGNPEYTPGGRALGFYSHVRCELRSSVGDRLTEGKKVIGQIVRFKVTKNKTSDPHKSGSYTLYYDGRIDHYDELISLGLLNESIIRRGPMYQFGDHVFKGKEALMEELSKNAELFEELKKIVFSNE